MIGISAGAAFYFRNTDTARRYGAKFGCAAVLSVASGTNGDLRRGCTSKKGLKVYAVSQLIDSDGQLHDLRDAAEAAAVASLCEEHGKGQQVFDDVEYMRLTLAEEGA